jgi:hypothetical protein
LIAYIDGMIDGAGLSASTDLDHVKDAVTTRHDYAGIKVKRF